MVGEIAARLSGGYMSGWTFPLSSGVEVTEAALNIAVGIPPGRPHAPVPRICAERALISIPGHRRDLWRSGGGAGGHRRGRGLSRVAAGRRGGLSRQQRAEVRKRARGCRQPPSGRRGGERAIAAIGIRLRPLVEATTRFLFHEHRPRRCRRLRLLSFRPTVPGCRRSGGSSGVRPRWAPSTWSRCQEGMQN